MADTTGGEIPSSDSSKDAAMCDSQSDVESTAATNGSSEPAPLAELQNEALEADTQNEAPVAEPLNEAPNSLGAPSPSSTTVDSSCGGSGGDEAKKDDRPSPQSSNSPLPSSFSICSPLVSSCGSSSSRSPLFAPSKLTFNRPGPQSSSLSQGSSSLSPGPQSSSLSAPQSSSLSAPQSSSLSAPQSSSLSAPQSSSLLSAPQSSSLSSPVRQTSRPLVLRPSQLGGGAGGSADSGSGRVNSPFVLKAPKLLSPFAGTKDEPEEPNSAEAEPLCVPEKDTTTAVVSSNVQESCSSTDNQITSSSSPTRPLPSSSSTSSTSSSLPSSSSSTAFLLPSSSSTSSASSSMAFVPLAAPPKVAVGSNSGSATQQTPSGAIQKTPAGATAVASHSRFVFGQNLHERVIVESSGVEAAVAGSTVETGAKANNGEASCSSATTNGTSEMLFSSVIQKELPDKSTENSVDDKNRKSLSEAAREYEESRAIKRKYEEVAVVTGEEEENNILQMDCKLFVYDNNKLNYSEGVHGMLRVNDPPASAKKSTGQSSRVIVRMSGSLRVLLNTKIWADMKIEKPNRKIVRMTAMDTNGQIKIFLISSSPSESEMLFRVLDARIKQQKEIVITCQNGNGSDTKAESDECTSSSHS